MPLDRTGEVLGLGWGICGQQGTVTMGNLEQSLYSSSSTASQFSSELQLSTKDWDLPGVTW